MTIHQVNRAPYCFVLMPFGKKPDPAGGAELDFDWVYRHALAPAIEAAGLHPHRDDQSTSGGIMQKQIFEALLLCEYAVADLTIENSNVFYELGVRHAVRPYSTLTVTARPDTIPFDVHNLRSVRYTLDRFNRLTATAAAALQDQVTAELSKLRKLALGRPLPDSPLFQLIEGWQPTPPESLRTDLFAQRVSFSEGHKQRLALMRAAAKRGGDQRARARRAAAALQEELGDLEAVEAGLLVDLLLTYRALEDWDAMVNLVAGMSGFVRDRVLVVEQLAFALNRRAEDGEEVDRDQALYLLRRLDEERRSSAETLGLMGRIYKDRWRSSGEAGAAQKDWLTEAIAAYRRGFRIDPRDPYPGVNAAALLDIEGSSASLHESARLLPVVRFATERLLDLEEPTYWSHATLLELAVLGRDEGAVVELLGQTRRAVRESWEPASTARNLRDLANARQARGEDVDWIRQIADELVVASN